MKKTENETAVIRYDYGDPTLGTCKETILGGNHFRYWPQEGSEANRCSSRRVSFDNSDCLFFRTHRSDLVGPFSWLFRMNSQIHVSPQSLCSFLTLTLVPQYFTTSSLTGTRFLLNVLFLFLLSLKPNLIMVKI